MRSTGGVNDLFQRQPIAPTGFVFGKMDMRHEPAMSSAFGPTTPNGFPMNLESHSKDYSKVILILQVHRPFVRFKFTTRGLLDCCAAAVLLAECL